MAPAFEKNFCPYCGENLSSQKLEGKDRDFCEACDRVIWRNASPVSAVIVERNDEILFVKRGIEPGKGKWSLPAGFLEYEEDPEKGALRELEEETGLKAKTRKLDHVDSLNVERFPGQRLLATVYRINYKDTEGNLQSGDDAREASFWKMNELRNDKNEELRTHFIEDIKSL